MKTFSLIFVALAVVVAGYLYLSSNFTSEQVNFSNEDSGILVEDNEPSEWIQYRNDDFGFMAEYPLEWLVEEEPGNQISREIYSVVFSEQEYDSVLSKIVVSIFQNTDKLTAHEWWNAWLSEEDAKKQDCIDEYGEGNAPCVFLRDLIVHEEQTNFAGLEAHLAKIFGFDSEQDCLFVVNGGYVYSVCYDSSNINDDDFSKHEEITSQIRDSIVFFEPVIPAITTSSIVGTWQSVDDVNSIKIFLEEGVSMEKYDEELIGSGVWEIAEKGNSELETLKIRMNDDVHEYTIVSIEDEQLILTYLPRGNTLTFARIE